MLLPITSAACIPLPGCQTIELVKFDRPDTTSQRHILKVLTYSDSMYAIPPLVFMVNPPLPLLNKSVVIDNIDILFTAALPHVFTMTYLFLTQAVTMAGRVIETGPHETSTKICSSFTDAT